MKKRILVDVSKVDWRLLRKQKYELVNLLDKRNDYRIHHDQSQALDGIINLLDSIQDQAAEQLGEKKVFGR